LISGLLCSGSRIAWRQRSPLLHERRKIYLLGTCWSPASRWRRLHAIERGHFVIIGSTATTRSSGNSIGVFLFTCLLSFVRAFLFIGSGCLLSISLKLASLSSIFLALSGKRDLVLFSKRQLHLLPCFKIFLLNSGGLSPNLLCIGKKLCVAWYAYISSGIHNLLLLLTQKAYINYNNHLFKSKEIIVNKMLTS
jgi:hypothetical protein